MTDTAISSFPTERSLLIVEDDKSLLQRLARAMGGRGFTVTTAESVSDGLLQVEKAAPAFAVVDMRLGNGNGLDIISAMKKRRPEARAIILTGYGNIANAVNAVKLGAVDYLAKPVDEDDVAAALLALDNKKIEPPENRCRPPGFAGSISSAFMNCAGAIFRKPRAASTCIAARCSASWPSAPPNSYFVRPCCKSSGPGAIARSAGILTLQISSLDGPSRMKIASMPTTPWINANRVYLLACYRSGSLRHCRPGSSSSLCSTHSRLSMLRSNLERCASFLREPSLSAQEYLGICGSQTLQFLL